MNFDTSQTQAITAATASTNHHIITGGAGTGKTTIVTALCNQLPGAILLAPTGKAAARLREVTGYEASTIHSFIQWDGSQVRRRANITAPIIIDEASMVGSWLLAQLLKFQPPKIVLVGDAAQIPPVDKGAPFHDLISLRPEMVSTLTKCHRASASIHAAAQMIRGGEMPANGKVGGEVFCALNTGNGAQTQAWFEREILVPEKFDPTQDAIICCRNTTRSNCQDCGASIPKAKAACPDCGAASPADTCTTTGLNQLAVQHLFTNDDIAQPWRVTDRVMNLKNNSGLDWWNGDTATITGIDTGGALWVQPDRPGPELELGKEAQRDLSLAYAFTIHKSQGSQYRRVFVVLLDRDRHMLNRNLIYTAVTRAREVCCVIGQATALRAGLGVVARKDTLLQCLAWKAGAVVE